MKYSVGNSILLEKQYGVIEGIFGARYAVRLQDKTHHIVEESVLLNEDCESMNDDKLFAFYAEAVAQKNDKLVNHIALEIKKRGLSISDAEMPESKLKEKIAYKTVEFEIEYDEDNITSYKAEVKVDWYGDPDYGADADGNRGVYREFVEEVKIESLYNETSGKEIDVSQLTPDELERFESHINSALEDGVLSEAKNEGEVEWVDYKGKKIKITVQPSGSSRLVQIGDEADFRPGKGGSQMVGYSNTRIFTEDGGYTGVKTSKEDLIAKGYDGVKWNYEETAAPEQLNIWNKKFIKTNIADTSII